MKPRISKRALAASVAAAAVTTPLPQLATATVEAAIEAGYGADDMTTLIAAVENELARRYGAVEVQVATAHATSSGQVDAIAAQVAKRVGARHYSVTSTVDPELIGGFEARVGEYVVSGSVRSELTELGVEYGTIV